MVGTSLLRCHFFGGTACLGLGLALNQTSLLTEHKPSCSAAGHTEVLAELLTRPIVFGDS